MIIVYLLLFSFLQSQTQPNIGLNENNPRVWALTNALVHTEPGDSIKDCTIIIRDGKIDKVGRYIRTPLDAFEIDMNGVSIYPGFIDSWYEVKRKTTIKNADDHWNKKIKADSRKKPVDPLTRSKTVLPTEAEYLENINYRPFPARKIDVVWDQHGCSPIECANNDTNGEYHGRVQAKVFPNFNPTLFNGDSKNNHWLFDLGADSSSRPVGVTGARGN